MTQAKLIILGCGNSTGVPAIGNYWGKCDPAEPKNMRSRSSVLLRTETATIVVDTGPDFKAQLNASGAESLDGVLYSHAHSDHINGIDELRLISYRRKDMVQIHGNKETLEELEHRFNYLFEGDNHEIYPPIVKPITLNYGQIHTIGDIEFTPFEQDHGTCKSTGYRFGDTAYCVDVFDLNLTAIETLRGVRNLIIDAAGYTMPVNKVHASLDKIYKWNKQIGAENVYLTSLTLSMDYQTLINELPQGYLPAYDGLEIDVELQKV